MRKKGFILGLLVLLLMPFITVEAKNDFIEAAETINATGKYDSSRFLVANEIKDSSEVDGLAFSAGNNVDISGRHYYGFYAGNNVVVKGIIDKDLFVAGNKITIDQSTIIGRDLYIAGNEAIVNANVNGNIRAVGNSIDLKGIKVNGSVNVEADEVILDANTVITGSLIYLENTKIVGKDEARVGLFDVKKTNDVITTKKVSFGNKLLSFVIWTVAAFLTITILFLAVPCTRETIDNIEVSAGSIFKRIGLGLVMLIVVPVVALIITFTRFLTPVGLITLATYIISLYLAIYLSAYLLGKEISSRLFKTDNVYLSICLGILIVKILALIPFIGGLVIFVCLLLGLGLIASMLGKRKN